MTGASSGSVWLAGEALTLGQGLYLVSWWKPLLFLPFFVVWAWVVSSVYDKDSARWYFKRTAWNVGHLCAAAVAIAVWLAVPLPVFATLPIAVLILATDLYIYFHLRNRDHRVPERMKWSAEYIKRWQKHRKAGREDKGLAKVTMTLAGPSGTIKAPMAETQEYQIRVWAEELLTTVIDRRASQLDIRPLRENVYVAGILVDGKPSAIKQMPGPEALATIDFFKSCAGLDVDDRRRKQRGEFSYGTASGNAMTIAEISTQGSSNGVRLTMRVDPASQVQIAFDDLGMLPKQVELAKKLVNDGQGVVLLASPPDGGRTATLYAFVRQHDAYTSNVQTLEFEPQSMIEGVRTNHFKPGEGGEFSTTLRSILRRDPDVVGVAEIPDEATAKEASLADHERTRQYLSLRAEDPLKAVQLWTRMVGKEKLAADSLSGVVAQRLIRRLCRNCRVAFQPTPDVLKKLGLPAETKQLYRKGGTVMVKDKEETCPACGGEGYLGQVGAFAVHNIGSEERAPIASGDLQALRSAWRQKKQMSIQQAALNHVINGVTSIDEVIRVTQPASKSKGGSAGGSSKQPPTAAKAES
jgi:type II secretory ATPase GspE/PulE/Tfp pilus assembly ATPase PilB-like protein